MQAKQNLFSPREDDVLNLIHMKSSLNSTIIMVRNEMQAQQNESNLSSTTSIIREEHQGEQNESISIRDVDVPSSVHRSFVLAEEKVVCTTATVYPIGDGILHFKKLLKGHINVSVIKVVEIHKSMELPVTDDEIPNLESVVKVFIQWPIVAIARFTEMSKTPISRVLTKRVMPQHENAPSTKKGKGNETPKEPNKH
nr:ulp1 protease family, C-terminal catalytic domain-containing protein [Tanacetum cinerariifolium]